MKTWIIRGACLAIVTSISLAPEVRAEGIFSRGGPDAGTQEYYQFHANSPVGSRQLHYKGKVWPPKPRPCGPKQPFAHKYHAATYWPFPYICQDRMAVASTVNAQIENGWMSSTTMYNFHFETETGELNTAGRKHLQWIVTFVPQEYQRLYVATSFDQRMNQARTSSIQNELAGMGGVNPNMPMELRAAHPITRNATIIESIERAHIENIPPPVIEYQAISSGGSGGS